MTQAQRRDEFEKAYAEAHDMRVEDFIQYRMGDTYRLPMIAKCWRFWQMALQADLEPSEAVQVVKNIKRAGKPAGEGV